MKVGILGSGEVARVLAAGFLKHGHEVTLGTREAGKLEEWASKHPGALVAGVAEAARFGDVVVLAVKGGAAEAALNAAGADALRGKTVIDATNPIADAPPDHGVLKYFTTLDDALMERLQRAWPETKFVKAFNSVGHAFMVNPQFPGGKPTMFICGNDEGAKETVAGILHEFGWESADMGGVEAARAIEPLCILWCLPGFARNEWTHAFKLLRMNF